ncbi:MAG: EAL domain-containing protein [Acidobacteria bacterium]|nr:EAL domain-containing protein [Acidobacteriota bacterium]
MRAKERRSQEVISKSTWWPRDWLGHWTGRTVAVLASVTAVYVLWQFLAAPTPRERTLVSDLTQALFAVAAFVVTLILARHPRLDAETRLAWKRTALAYGSFAGAQLTWFYYSQIQMVRPFPSLADVGYLAFYPLMLIALLSFPAAEQSRLHRRKFILDTISVMIAGTTVVWYFIVLPTIVKNTDFIKIGLNIGYVVGDLVLLLGITTILLRRPPEHIRRALLLVVAGLINLLFADLSFAFVTLHGLGDSGPFVSIWVTGPFLLIAASLYKYHLATIAPEPLASVAPESFVPKFSWLPYVAIFVGYGVLVYSATPYWSQPHGIVIVAALILTAIVVLRQITAVKENIRLHSLQAARESESHFRTLIENSSDIVMIFDLHGRITYQSPSVERILGYGQDSLVGEYGFSFIHPEDLPILKDASRQLMREMDVELMRECRFRHFDGSWRILEGIAKIITDDESGARGVLLNARDVNERKALESKIIHQAFHDPLTNLANRLLFKSRVEEALIGAADGEQLAVLFLDLDDFKNINDTFGHDAGDKLLIEFTEKLRLCVRARDTVARLGGDEFAILIEGDDVREKAVSVAKRILDNVRQSINVNGFEMKIGISIGIAFKDGGEMTADDLLRNADVAMYAAKGKGKNRHVVFETEMHRNLLAQIELENDLRQAIDNNQLHLNYQPIMNMTTGQVTGMEALVRWDHPVHGLIPPIDFIGLAEQTGLIVPLGRWILLETCLSSKALFERHGNDLTVTINISGKQLEHPDFIDDLAEVIAKVKINPGNIILEITESTMMEDTESILKLLHRIKSLGIRLAIDDFGTGYSSLSYLQQFPIDILKIDRSFVKGIEASPQKNAVARTIISLSSTLQLATVAEGIENDDQAEILRELGCEFGQGYFFARPMAISEFEALLVNMNTSSAVFAPREEMAEMVSVSIN